MASWYLRDTTVETCASGAGAPDTYDMQSTGGTQYNTYADCEKLNTTTWIVQLRFYRTVGAVNATTVKRYVEESQEKHWNHEADQKKLIEF